MGTADFIILGLVASWLILVVLHGRKRKKSGKCEGCCGCCTSCSVKKGENNPK